MRFSHRTGWIPTPLSIMNSVMKPKHVFCIEICQSQPWNGISSPESWVHSFYKQEEKTNPIGWIKRTLLVGAFCEGNWFLELISFHSFQGLHFPRCRLWNIECAWFVWEEITILAFRPRLLILDWRDVGPNFLNEMALLTPWCVENWKEFNLFLCFNILIVKKCKAKIQIWFK